MILMMLENVGQAGSAGDEIVFSHVDARLSEGMDDVGSWRAGKVFQLLGYIFQAWRVWWHEKPEAFYYVPAPAKRSALYRDWLVLLLVAPLFKFRVFHWHAVGLGKWVAEGVTQGAVRQIEASITRLLFSGKELSIVLNEEGRRDVEIFTPRRITIVPNGIPDPCPDFATTLLPERLRRHAEQIQPGAKPVFSLLYLAHATHTKGLFDAIEAVALTNARFVAEKSTARIRLTVAGAFVDREEETAFHERLKRDDLLLGDAGEQAVIYAGYVGPEEKHRLLSTSDALCFASYFPNEGQPVSIIEALAYGLPVLLSRWRGLPEMVPPALAHLTDPRDPASLAQALPLLLQEGRFDQYRQCYLDRYSLASHCQRMKEAFLSLTLP